jgi:hypothetical protein
MANLSADTSNLQELVQDEQVLTIAANQAVTNAPITTLPSVPMTMATRAPMINNAPLTATEANATEISRERLDHTKISQANTTTTLAATTEEKQETSVVVTGDVTDSDLANTDLTDATFEINPDLIAPFQQEPTLTEKIKWAFAFLRMKMNIAYDSTGTAISNGYDTVTIHLSKHKKAYIIGTVCVGGVVLGAWYFKTRK